LVLTCSPTPSFRKPALSPPAVLIPENLKTPVSPLPGFMSGNHCGDGYRFAKPQGKLNSPNPAVMQQTGAFALLRQGATRIRSDSIHRKA
jgi:hypothetical protein